MIWQVLERVFISKFTVFLSLAFIVIYALSDYIRYACLAFRTPGPKAYPLIGCCLFVKKSDFLSKYVANAYKDYGPIARIWLGVLPFFVVLEPEYLQIILGSQKHTEKSFFYKHLPNFLGKGLITSSGEKWSNHRKLLQPTFHLNILEKFITTFAESARILIEKLRDESEINITTFINDCVLDILHESVLGVPVCGEKSSMENSPFQKGKVVMPHRIANPWLLFSWIYKFTKTANEELEQKKRLDEFTRKIINKRREKLKCGEIVKRKSLLDHLLDISDIHPQFTEDDIVDEVCTFMLAGQDSVGASLAISIFLLAQHQEHQQRCTEEINAIFGEDDRTPTMDDLRGMKYLEMCINEALRLYPSIPMFARCLGEDVKCGKTVLPAGCEMVVMTYATHRIEHIYPEPEKFKPERFLPENCEKRNPYAFLPFSGGPRNCIGLKFAMLEMKTVISTILRHFILLPVAGKTTLEPLFRMTLRARGGLMIRLEPRNNNSSKN